MKPLFNIAMKTSLAQINWENEAFPDTLRGTIHHKTAPVLGVRIYPGYKKKCQLLPYHGIARIKRIGERWEMTIEHEIYQHENPKVLCVANDAGVSDFYIDREDLNFARNSL